MCWNVWCDVFFVFTEFMRWELSALAIPRGQAVRPTGGGAGSPWRPTEGARGQLKQAARRSSEISTRRRASGCRLRSRRWHRRLSQIAGTGRAGRLLVAWCSGVQPVQSARPQLAHVAVRHVLRQVRVCPWRASAAARLSMLLPRAQSATPRLSPSVCVFG